MYHICYSNPRAWEISYENGIYGNVATGNDNLKTFWGKIIDLAALITGDKVFFYVKEEMKLYGLFQIQSDPFYFSDDLFDDENEFYPFRFQFNEIKKFENPIPVSELASLIERGLINSITTFERDQNAQFRSIRQLTDEEGQIIEDTFFKYNPKGNFNNVKLYNHNRITVDLEADIIISSVSDEDELLEPTIIRITSIPVNRIRANQYIAKYENSLQGYIYYCLRRNLNNVIEDLDLTNFTECLMEVPMLKAQQFRSDILCIFRQPGKPPHFYSIIETKKDRQISIQDLSQLIGYMKTFSASKGISFNCIEGVYISKSFAQEAINYLRDRKSVEKENPIRLITYEVTNSGEVTFANIDI